MNQITPQKIHGTDNTLANLSPPQTADYEDIVIQEIRRHVAEVLSNCKLTPEGEIPAVLYFALFAVDPDFASSAFYPSHYSAYSGSGEEIISGMTLLFSNGISDLDAISFARAVLSEGSKHLYSARIAQELVKMFASSGRSNVLSAIFYDRLVPAPQILERLIFFLQSSPENLTTISQALENANISVNLSHAIRGTIYSMIEYSTSPQDAPHRYWAMNLPFLAKSKNLGIIADSLKRWLAQRSKALQYVTPTEAELDLMEDVVIPREQRFSWNDFAPLENTLRKSGYLIWSSLKEYLLDEILELWAEARHGNEQRAVDDAEKIPLQIRHFAKLASEKIEECGRFNITKNDLLEILRVVGIISHTNYWGRFTNLANSLRTRETSVFGQLEDCEIEGISPPCGSIPNSEIASISPDRFVDLVFSLKYKGSFSLKQICDLKEVFFTACNKLLSRNTSGNDWVDDLGALVRILRDLPIAAEQKREIISLALAQTNPEDAEQFFCFYNKEALRTIEWLYAPLSDYRGGLRGRLGEEGALCPLPPAFIELMYEKVPLVSVPSKDQEGMIKYLAQSLISAVTLMLDSQASVVTPVPPGALNNSLFTHSRATQKSIAPLSTSEIHEQKVGTLSKPLTGIDRYLIASLCSTYDRATMRYTPLGSHASSLGVEREIAKLLSRYRACDIGERFKLSMSLFDAQDGTILPIPITAYSQEIKNLRAAESRTHQSVEFRRDFDAVPFLFRGLGQRATSITFDTVVTHDTSISLDTTVAQARGALRDDIRKTLTKKGVPKGDLPPLLQAWITSVREDDRLLPKVEELLTAIGKLYLYDTKVADSPKWKKMLATDRSNKKLRKDPYLVGIHAAKIAPYSGRTVCGGAAHIAVQAMRHAGIPCLAVGGFLVPPGATEFNRTDAHSFPVLILPTATGITPYPIEATQYMSKAAESAALPAREESSSPLLKDLLPTLETRIALERYHQQMLFEAIGETLSLCEASHLAETLINELHQAGRIFLVASHRNGYEALLHILPHLYSAEGLHALNHLSSAALSPEQSSLIRRFQKDVAGVLSGTLHD